MSERLSIQLLNRQQAWSAIKVQLYPFLAQVLQADRRWLLTIKQETRTESQNRLMWPILTAFSHQLLWPVNGRMETLPPEEWKDILTAAWAGESVRLAMGLSGGVVMLGQRTSKFTKQQFSEFVEFLYATAADREVVIPEQINAEEIRP